MFPDIASLQQQLVEVQNRQREIAQGLIDICLVNKAKPAEVANDNHESSPPSNGIDKEMEKRMAKFDVVYVDEKSMKEKFVGSNDLIDELLLILTFLDQPQVWNEQQRVQIQCRTALLFGPVGTGKTLAIFHFVMLTGIPIIHFRLAGVEDRYVGDNGNNMIAIFKKASQYPRCIILMDEIGKLLVYTIINCKS